MDLENTIDDADQVQNVFYDVLDPLYRAGLATPLAGKLGDVKGFCVQCSAEDKTCRLTRRNAGQAGANRAREGSHQGPQ